MKDFTYHEDKPLTKMISLLMLADERFVSQLGRGVLFSESVRGFYKKKEDSFAPSNTATSAFSQD